MISKIFGVKSNCTRAAKAALGPEAIPGVDFSLHQDGRGWTWQVISQAEHVASEPSPVAPERPASKIGKGATCKAMMSRPEGASNADLQNALGWQAHTIRGFISGLKKKGVPVLSERKDGQTIYRIVTA